MRLVLGCLILMVAAAPVSAADAPSWGDLDPGPHAVGFQQWERYDYARTYRQRQRLDGSLREGERARPIRVSLWYPSEPSSGAPLTVGDYAAMIAGEARFGKLTPAQVREGEGTLFALPLLRDLTVPQRDRLKALAGRAVRDARPAAGRFPVVLYSLGSAAIAHVTPEYLASHGYVVVQAPRLGNFAGLPPDTADGSDMENKLRDMDFLLNALRDFPSADLHRLGALGFSAGGRWALSEAMRHADVRAVVSLDTVLLFDDAVTRTWKGLPFFNLDAVRVPVLHLVRKEWIPQEDVKLWEGLRYAERTHLRFDDPVLDHFDFQSIGYATVLAGGRAAAAPPVRATFGLFHRYTLAFLDAHVKGDAAARAFLARSPEQNGAPAGLMAVARLPAERAPLGLADLLSAIDEGGVAPAIAAYRQEWQRTGTPPAPEGPINISGYLRLLAGSTSDALQLFELNVEAYPTSANVYDSLADAYAQKGDAAKARELAQKCLGLLEQDASLTPERKRLIRESAEQKLAPAPAPIR